MSDVKNDFVSDDPIIKGYWEPIKYRFKSLPVHIALLHTGQVLGFGGSGNDPDFLDNPFPAEIFDPGDIGHDNGRVYAVSNDGIEGDLFCAGHTFLPDGKLLVNGGTYKYDGTTFGLPIPPFSGLEQTYIFDPKKLTWSRKSDMKHGRWYPTSIMIPDGKIITLAGLTKKIPWAFLREIEVYDEQKNKWEILKGADRWLPLYPRLHLLPNGMILFAGSYNTHYTFPFSVRAFPSALLDIYNNKWKNIGLPKDLRREEGTTVMLPLDPPDYNAKVLLIGGGTPQGKDTISKVEVLDFSKSEPNYEEFPSLNYPRYYVYATILPDKTILVLGGTTKKEHHTKTDKERDHNHENSSDIIHDPNAVLIPELLDLNQNNKTKNLSWIKMAKMKLDRLYHSNAILLPDGRVMTCGSNPERKENELRIELYHPPYLFKGERPQINKVPEKLNYGDYFDIETSYADKIKSVVLIRPSVTTHCVNVEQRYVGLEFNRNNTNSNILTATLPSNKNLIPPGYYMLFIVDENDIPSIAKFVLV